MHYKILFISIKSHFIHIVNSFDTLESNAVAGYFKVQDTSKKRFTNISQSSIQKT